METTQLEDRILEAIEHVTDCPKISESDLYTISKNVVKAHGENPTDGQILTETECFFNVSINTNTMKTATKPQQKVLDIMEKYEAPFHFIAWGLNYYQLRDANHDYKGRVRHCVFDALVRKELIEYGEDGWHIPANN